MGSTDLIDNNTLKCILKSILKSDIDEVLFNGWTQSENGLDGPLVATIRDIL